MCAIALVDISMFLLNLNALVSIFTDISSMIIGFVLCTKLDANGIIALVSF